MARAGAMDEVGDAVRGGTEGIRMEETERKGRMGRMAELVETAAKAEKCS